MAKWGSSVHSISVVNIVGEVVVVGVVTVASQFSWCGW